LVKSFFESKRQSAMMFSREVIASAMMFSREAIASKQGRIPIGVTVTKTEQISTRWSILTRRDLTIPNYGRNPAKHSEAEASITRMLCASESSNN
jgi:hypothetical protein